MAQQLIRTFICIELPDELKTRIGEIQAQLKPYSSGISWVRPQNIHLTLKFLGNVEEAQIDALGKRVSEMAVHYTPFTLIPEGKGVFPHEKSPRVFWIGIGDDSGKLVQLAERIEEGLVQFGFEKEKRPFKPHLTIARVRPFRKPKELTPAFLATAFSSNPFEVDHITIMRSDLEPTGAVYTPLKVVSLKQIS
jgi:2'-5' RNA ligase